MANIFGANRTPECYLFNKEEKLVYHGAIDDNARSAESVGRHHLKEAINELTSGRDISSNRQAASPQAMPIPAVSQMHAAVVRPTVTALSF